MEKSRLPNNFGLPKASFVDDLGFFGRLGTPVSPWEIDRKEAMGRTRPQTEDIDLGRNKDLGQIKFFRLSWHIGREIFR